MNTSQPLRRAHLASYLRELGRDVAAQGKIAKIVGNPIEVAAVAIMSGSIAFVEMLWQDVASFTGEAKVQAQVAARPVLEQLAQRGAGFLLDKLFPAKR